MYGHESWTIWSRLSARIDDFKMWYWRRPLRVPWTARRSNQSILKEINPEYSLEGLMLKLKLQYFGHLMQRADSVEKTLMVGKIEGKGEGGQSIRASASASVLPMNIQGWFPLGLTDLISLQSKRLLQHHSLKASILQCSAFFIVQLSHPYMTTGKTIALALGYLLAK